MIATSRLFDWRLQAVVLILSCIAEAIGIAKFNIGIGTMILLPLLYAFLFSVFFNPNVIPSLGKVVGDNGNKIAGQWILICLMPFIAKFAVGIGPKVNDIIAAGPALVFQEIGNVATVLFALPIAVLLFGMGRESIGATHSIAREPNIALIADRFGLKTPEGIGVMGVYVMGTLFGAIYFSVMAGIVASWDVFDIRALAMACGVGSGSMMGACSTALAELMPEAKSDIVAFAASSNLLTYATGLFVSLFVALPFAEWMYKVLSKLRKNKNADNTNALAHATDLSDTEEIHLSVGQQISALILMSILLLIVNWVSTGTDPVAALPGMIILFVCSVLGIFVKKIVPIGVPSVAWISIIAIIAALPFMPTGSYVIETTNKLGLLPLITPALAYAGIAISKSEVALFKQAGFKIAIVALLTFTGTFIGSVLIAQALL